MEPKIALQGVTKIFYHPKRGQVPALDRVDISLADHEFYCLVGPSGCGKSTALNLIAGFDRATTGTITVGGRAVTGPGPERGVVFQEHGLFPWLTALDNVRFGPSVNGNRAALGRAREFLNLVGLAGFEKHYPRELSGGMRQRVALARVLVNAPQVLLMAEPFGALAAQPRTQMHELLLEIWTKLRTTIFFITHDVDEAIFLSDRVGILTARPGRVKREFKVGLHRPRSYRDLASPAFGELKRAVLDELRAETQGQPAAREGA